MHNFSDQCLDLARALLGNNLQYINEDGTITLAAGESSRIDEPGHAALAIGEFFERQVKPELAGFDLFDLSARCVTHQAFSEEASDNGMAYAALGLLSFGASKERNSVWERLLDPTREQLDQCLLTRTERKDHYRAFNVAKSVARFSFGLSKKTIRVVSLTVSVEHLETKSSSGFFNDDESANPVYFHIYGLLSFIFIRQAL